MALRSKAATKIRHRVEAYGDAIDPGWLDEVVETILHVEYDRYNLPETDISGEHRSRKLYRAKRQRYYD